MSVYSCVLARRFALYVLGDANLAGDLLFHDGTALPAARLAQVRNARMRQCHYNVRFMCAFLGG